MIALHDFRRVVRVLGQLDQITLVARGIIRPTMGHWKQFQDDPIRFLTAIASDDHATNLWGLVQETIAAENENIDAEQFYRNLRFGISDCIGLDREKLLLARKLQAAGKVTISDSPAGPLIRLVDSTRVNIVAHDNQDRDSISEILVAGDVSLGHALPMVEALNTSFSGEQAPYFFVLKHADHPLHRFTP